jgi:hypothetical protein
LATAALDADEKTRCRRLHRTSGPRYCSPIRFHLRLAGLFGPESFIEFGTRESGRADWGGGEARNTDESDRATQPYSHFDRAKADRYQVNVADVDDAIQTAVGGNAITQVLQGEQLYDLVLRYRPQYRDRKRAIENIRLLTPTNERVSLAQLTDIRMADGASEIYREANLGT